MSVASARRDLTLWLQHNACLLYTSSEEGLKVLTRKRGGLKSARVRIQSAVNSFDITLSTKHFLTVRLDSLKSLASKYDEVQSEIELISKDTSCLLYTSRCV